jgi:hypothetical protein
VTLANSATVAAIKKTPKSSATDPCKNKGGTDSSSTGSSYSGSTAPTASTSA